MADKKIICGIDVGTTKIVAIIAEYDGKSISVVGFGETPSIGLERGVIVNVPKTIKTLENAIQQAENQCSHKVDSVYVGISGDHIKGHNASGVISVNDASSDSYGTVITQEDKKNVLEHSKQIPLSQDRRILHTLSQHFNVDDSSPIEDPEGLTGNKLEAKVHLVTSSKKTENDFETCFAQLDIDIAGFVLEPLASSYSILSDDEKNLGTILIDIGGGTTDMVIWKNGGIIDTHVIPLGGESITKDIAIGLSCELKIAERIKIEYGSASEALTDDEEISIRGVEAQDNNITSNSKFISKIIEHRVSEIFQISKFQIDRMIDIDQIAFGVIITGGGGKIVNITNVAESIFNRQVRIGKPFRIQSIIDDIYNPKYSTAVGIIHYAITDKGNYYSKENSFKSSPIKKIFSTIKDLFN